MHLQVQLSGLGHQPPSRHKHSLGSQLEWFQCIFYGTQIASASAINIDSNKLFLFKKKSLLRYNSHYLYWSAQWFSVYSVLYVHHHV